jgi:hypothetical protein
MQVIAISRDFYLGMVDISALAFIIKTTAIMGFISAVLLDWAVVMNFKIKNTTKKISLIVSVALLLTPKSIFYEQDELLIAFCLLVAVVNLINYMVGVENMPAITKRYIMLGSVLIANSAIFFSHFEIYWMSALVLSSIFPLVFRQLFSKAILENSSEISGLKITLDAVVMKTLLTWSIFGFILYKADQDLGQAEVFALRLLSYEVSFYSIVMPLLWRTGSSRITSIVNYVILSGTAMCHFMLLNYTDITLIESVQYVVITVMFGFIYVYTLYRYGR